MKKRMNLRKNVKIEFVKLIIILGILVLSFWLTFKILYNSLNIEVDNSLYLNYLVNDSMSTYSLSDLSNMTSTEFLLKYSFGIDKFNSGTELDITTPVVNAKNNEEQLDPIVYIFNTHQTEGYRSNFLDTFNINNTVYLGSHILGEYLRDLGIGVVVEENSVVDILNANGWKYGYSYKASRMLLEQAYQNNNTLNFFVDLHRDAASYERTLLEDNGVKYAKVLFVVGLEHENYQANLDLAKNLNERLKQVKPGLSRGVLEKKGPGVNGKYNQDFNPNTILIEVGGQYNYIEEVNNSLKIVAQVLYDYLKGY